jgi:hypothetical protein
VVLDQGGPVLGGGVEGVEEGVLDPVAGGFRLHRMRSASAGRKGIEGERGVG